MTDEMKQKRQHLAELSRVIKMKIQQGVTSAANVNEGLIEFYSEGEDLEFNTFFEWKKLGYSIKKGSKAFLVWGKPRKIPVINTEKDSDQEEDEFKFWPVAYLFSEKQVEKERRCSMKWLEIFIEWLDSLYYQGFASQLQSDDPERFQWEYDHFIENY